MKKLINDTGGAIEVELEVRFGRRSAIAVLIIAYGRPADKGGASLVPPDTTARTLDFMLGPVATAMGANCLNWGGKNRVRA